MFLYENIDFAVIYIRVYKDVAIKIALMHSKLICLQGDVKMGQMLGMINTASRFPASGRTTTSQIEGKTKLISNVRS